MASISQRSVPSMSGFMLICARVFANSEKRFSVGSTILASGTPPSSGFRMAR